MKCPNCGANIKRMSYKCEYCGTEISEFSNDPLSVPINTSPFTLHRMLQGLALFAFAALLYITYVIQEMIMIAPIAIMLVLIVISFLLSKSSKTNSSIYFSTAAMSVLLIVSYLLIKYY